MKRIIVNADDFGINEVVTSEIERQMLLDNVSSTTIMANGSGLDEVKRFACQHPEFSYGVHLCLSEFASLTKSEGLFRSGLTDENGEFVHKAIFHLKNLKDNLVQNAIIEELNAQIDLVSSLGFPLSHADSHHHVHTIYPLRELFADILMKHGIRRIRLGGGFRTFRMRRHLILWLQREKLNRFYNTQFSTTDAFFSYEDYLRNGQCCGGDIVELMCHPGHPNQLFCKEMKLVESKEALKNKDIKLITYNDIP
jgi:predicted glycoside hydrolase/deacetylase ChbG (UPF0249 family)